MPMLVKLPYPVRTLADGYIINSDDDLKVILQSTDAKFEHFTVCNKACNYCGICPIYTVYKTGVDGFTVM